MTSLWPWLAVAGIGALHGLNPAGGWLWAAAWGLRSGDRTQALRALLPIAAGHIVSVALVATAVPLALSLGSTMDRTLIQIAIVGLLGAATLHCLRGRTTGRTGLALGSFIVSTVQGAGLMLVPAIIPLCIGSGTVREITATGSLTMAVAVVGVHLSAMLVVTGGMALAVCCGAGRMAKFKPFR